MPDSLGKRLQKCSIQRCMLSHMWKLRNTQSDNGILTSRVWDQCHRGSVD